MQILMNHTTKETAYLVEDYPYGFRLRCKIRYWLEYKPGKGYRLVSQTTNPKKPGEVWNKEKASTYSLLGGAMYLDDNNHVQWAELNEYHIEDGEAFLATYGHTLPEHGRKELEKYVAIHKAYEAKKATGTEYRQAAREAITEYHRPTTNQE